MNFVCAFNFQKESMYLYIMQSVSKIGGPN